MRNRTIAFLIGTSACVTSVHAADWLQFGYDQAHSGFNPAEVGYSTATGNIVVSAFAGGITLTHQTDSAPIFLGAVTTASGTKDLLFINALDGTITAKDASNGATVWSHQPPVASGSDFILAHGGATGSPAVDPSLQFVFHYGLDGKIHKYQVGDGTETITGGWPEITTAKPDQEKGASAMSIAVTPSGTFLYSVNDGYDGDGGDYQGHITTINLATGTQTVFNSECSNLSIHFIKNGVTSGAGQNDCASRQNGIWGRPGAIYDPGTNRVFISTGNGPFNANTGGFNWGDSVLALHADGTGAGAGMPVDSYTPTTFQQLQNTDADLGSVSVALVPPPPGTAAAYLHIGVQPGKDGCVRLINLADMSGQGGPTHTGGELDAKDLPGGSNCASGSDGPEIKPQPAVWVNPADSSTWVYVSSYNNATAAYKISLDGSGKPSLAQQWSITSANGGSGTSPVIANGTFYYQSGNKVKALNATTGASIWTSASIGSSHWQSLILVNSRIYVIDNTSKLWALQLDGIFKNGLQ